jgi:uncharacterized protein (TIGR00730 family)
MDDKNKKRINLKSEDLHLKPLTLKEVHQVCIPKDLAPRDLKINAEIVDGLEFIRKHPRSVTFFGSARFEEGNPYYEKAKNLAGKIVKEIDYTVVTGGGPGIMEAGNRGAFEAKGNSLGITIELPTEQRLNPYVTDSTDFYYFFTRKLTLAFSAETYVYFPGGLGTLDEFFEIMTLIQTGKIARVPIILVGDDFWKPIEKWLDEMLYQKFKTIDKKDLNLFTITEDEDKIIDIIKSAPLREED